jgi:hypothetical protein
MTCCIFMMTSCLCTIFVLARLSPGQEVAIFFFFCRNYLKLCLRSPEITFPCHCISHKCKYFSVFCIEWCVSICINNWLTNVWIEYVVLQNILCVPYVQVSISRWQKECLLKALLWRTELNIVNDVERTNKWFMNMHNVHSSIVCHNLIYYSLILHVGY